MPYVNSFNCCGRLASAPSLGGEKGDRAKFIIALNKPGAPKPAYIDCILWGPGARIFTSVSGQGDEVFLSGELETSTYVDDRGSWHKSVCLRVEQYALLGRSGGSRRALVPPV